MEGPTVVTSDSQAVNIGMLPVQTVRPGCCACGVKNTRLYARLTWKLGKMQVVFGLVCALVNSLAIGYHHPDVHVSVQMVGAGIWTGATFIVSGAFGISAGRSKTNGMIITYMVMSIVSAVLSIITLGFGAGQISQTRDFRSWACVEYHYWNDVECDKWRQNLFITTGAIQVVCAILEAVVAILSSALCCHAVCCCQTSQQLYSPASVVIAYRSQDGQISYVQQNMEAYPPTTHPFPGHALPTSVAPGSSLPSEATQPSCPLYTESPPQYDQIKFNKQETVI